MKNPNKIIVKNKFYHKGLTEKQIFDYYQRVRQDLVSENKERDIVMVVFPKMNVPIIKRKIQNKPIILTNSNYDNILNGSTISLFSVMKRYEKFGVLDIDINDNFPLAKKATLDIYNYLNDNVKFIEKIDIKYTGKHSFHLIVNFTQKNKIEDIKNILRHTLNNKYLIRRYTMQYKRTKNVPNMDLSSNKFNGAHISPYSLSSWGLKCEYVDPNNLMSLKQSDFKIKI